MPDIRYVRKTGGLLVACFTDDSQLTLYPTSGQYWAGKHGAATPPPPPPPDPEDPEDPPPPPDPDTPPPTPGTGTWVHPLPGGIVTSPYGPRGGDLHAGADISTPKANSNGIGGNILAICDMTITIAKEWGTGGLPDAGTYVKGHGYGKDGTAYSFSHFHGHPGTLAVSVGQKVAAGTKLMNEGNSGNSFGSHLHLEVWPGHRAGDFFYWGDGTPPDPLPILRANGINI